MDCGNPGKEYAKTKHNMGFVVIDKIAHKLNTKITKNKFDGLIGEANFNGEKIILLKPQTYMNLSGNSVKQLMDFYKADVGELIVIYDDIDIEIGKIRVRKKGSAGQHNGMKSIVQNLGDTDFARVRVGIGKPLNEIDLADYVLSPFYEEEQTKIDSSTDDAANAVILAITSGIDTAMNKYN